MAQKNEMRAALLKQLMKAIGTNRMKGLEAPTEVEVIEIEGPEDLEEDDEDKLDKKAMLMEKLSKCSEEELEEMLASRKKD